ncbi:methyltransferase N6AMT1 [Callorhinchus milii]|uniref:Methyltransferase HEMK2 n=1 Tax=Callorhinchus milii TaxID=7868 RepID=A0A4W3JE38_CALMI|nr:methyltransferase N6AMT1 [Callorhinchus milii]XP_042190199.1 methyltransferase N6AMT1 [Callorhinchus milii]XP_042190200.1 methyltransferase N6AMT1 [Callorhinchus milii]|eukprot:gi/632970594/ref/XP_007901739.1/ PREDICTED: hemK methyltransferase family member 2 [Callorhinchus milii]
MFSTPYSSHVGCGDYADVYDPAEDSFLLMDALEKDVKEITRHCPRICLEVGAGSGVVSVFLASIVGSKSLYLCTDINPLAAACTVETAKRNGVNIQPIITDLITGLLPRLQNQVDVLIFNPPYVVTPLEEVGSNGIEASWAGGERGREVMDRLFPHVPSLLSSHGLFYLVVVQENNPEEIKQLLRKSGLKGTVIISRQAGREHLSVLKFWKA